METSNKVMTILPTSSHHPRIQVAFLGSHGVGKTAIVVRYLTNRFIHEYCSGKDLLYKKTVRIDGIPSMLEIADTSNPSGDSAAFPSIHVAWADACVVVYSVQSLESFRAAAEMLETVQRIKAPFYVPVLLIANQKDLEHSRRVPTEDGQAMAVSFNCHFAEITAAQEAEGLAYSLNSLFREVRTLKSQRTPAVRQTGRSRPALQHVSKLFSSLIGRGGTQQDDQAEDASPKSRGIVKKRPSFSL